MSLLFKKDLINEYKTNPDFHYNVCKNTWEYLGPLDWLKFSKICKIFYSRWDYQKYREWTSIQCINWGINEILKLGECINSSTLTINRHNPYAPFSIKNCKLSPIRAKIKPQLPYQGHIKDCYDYIAKPRKHKLYAGFFNQDTYYDN